MYRSLSHILEIVIVGIYISSKKLKASSINTLTHVWFFFMSVRHTPLILSHFLPFFFNEEAAEDFIFSLILIKVYVFIRYGGLISLHLSDLFSSLL